MKLEEAIKSTNFKDERHRATLNLLYTAYWFKTSMSAALKEQGITSEQHNVMRILRGSHPEKMCVKEIASRIVEKNSNVPRIIDRLVTKKLVKRTQSKTDKRETLVQLTEAGINTVDRDRKIVEAYSDAAMNITQEEARILNNLLEKMREPKNPQQG